MTRAVRLRNVPGTSRKHSKKGTGTVDPDWIVTANIYAQFSALADNGRGVLYAGGSFTMIHEQVRAGLVAFRAESVLKGGCD